jgi:hypothetical protein
MFIYYYQRCDDGPVKARAIADRYAMINMLWQQQQVPTAPSSQSWSLMNSASNVMMSQLWKSQPNNLQPTQ